MDYLETLKNLITGGASSEIKFSTADEHPAMPNYSYVFSFEKEFNQNAAKSWFDNNWKLSFPLVAVYLLAIVLARGYMANRPRCELKWSLFLWNSMLAVFSIWGTLRTIPEMFHVVSNFGLNHSICYPSYEYDMVAAFWTTMFSFSKAVELVDTAFVVLRKRPLIFLHYYHHATVLIYTWYSATDYTAPGRWFTAMNFTVHSLMYSYYALSVVGCKLPRFVSLTITSLQLSQMGVGVFVTVWAYQNVKNGIDCHVSALNLRMSFLMYFSYFLLFAHFFYKAYICKQTSQQRPKGTKAKFDAKKKE